MSTELVSTPIVSREALVTELHAIETELSRRRWRRDPLSWVRDRLQIFLWSKQREILQALRDHRRVAVKSCHEIGKSFIAAVAAGWWIDTAGPGEAFVVTSAPTGPQVRTILWREIGRVHSRGKLPGRTNQTEWLLPMPSGKEEQVAIGRKPDEYDFSAFQGIHAREVLCIFDEACGIHGNLWEAGDSLIANDYSKFLAIGNPDVPDTEFFELCKPGSGWHVITVGAFDTPNFTGEDIPSSLRDLLIGKTYVEEKRRKWAPGWRWSDDGKHVTPPTTDRLKALESAGPFWCSKVLGEFPPNAEEGGLIPISWVKAAQERTLDPGEPNELGVDVGAGGDASVIAHRQGSVVRIIHEDHNPNTMETAGNVIAARRRTGAMSVKVDKIGIGAGIVDRGHELGEPFVGVNVGEAADDPENYVNLRAELYWGIRERFEDGDVDLDPEDDDTAAELCSIRYKRTSRGQIQIESKDDAKRRGVSSPNRAEAVMLAFSKERRRRRKVGGLLFKRIA